MVAPMLKQDIRDAGRIGCRASIVKVHGDSSARWKRPTANGGKPSTSRKQKYKASLPLQDTILKKRRASQTAEQEVYQDLHGKAKGWETRNPFDGKASDGRR